MLHEITQNVMTSARASLAVLWSRLHTSLSHRKFRLEAFHLKVHLLECAAAIRQHIPVGVSVVAKGPPLTLSTRVARSKYDLMVGLHVQTFVCFQVDDRSALQQKATYVTIIRTCLVLKLYSKFITRTHARTHVRTHARRQDMHVLVNAYLRDSLGVHEYSL